MMTGNFHSRSRTAFTLIELLVVIAIIGTMIGVIGLSMQGGTSATALQSSQSTLASLLSSARGQAALAGRDAAILLNANPGSADRYLRCFVVAVKNVDNVTWNAVSEPVYLPTNIYVLPRDGVTAAQVNVVDDWRRRNGDPLSSTAFAAAPISQPILNNVAETWWVRSITALGNSSGGDVVLATGEPQPPGSPEPVKFNNAEFVRGIAVSSYGVATFINDRPSF